MYIGICILGILLGCLLFFLPSIVDNGKSRITGSKLVLLRIAAAILFILGIAFLYYLVTDKIALPLQI